MTKRSYYRKTKKKISNKINRVFYSLRRPATRSRTRKKIYPVIVMKFDFFFFFFFFKPYSIGNLRPYIINSCKYNKPIRSIHTIYTAVVRTYQPTELFGGLRVIQKYRNPGTSYLIFSLYLFPPYTRTHRLIPFSSSTV